MSKTFGTRLLDNFRKYWKTLLWRFRQVFEHFYNVDTTCENFLTVRTIGNGLGPQIQALRRRLPEINSGSWIVCLVKEHQMWKILKES